MDKFAVSKKIKAERDKAEWTQTYLANQAGITPSALSQIESGERFPSTDVLRKIAKALSTSIDYLLGHNEKEDLMDLLQNKDVEILFRGFKELSSGDKKTILSQIDFLKTKKR